MMPTNVAARMTLAADPGSLQGAVAAGILGAGPVILGTSEACARLLEGGAVASGRDAARDRRARSTRPAERCPGFGHPVHRPLDPRAERILELADERGVSGAARRCSRARFRDAVHEAWGKPLTMNVAMPIAAVLLDLGFPAASVKAVPLLARTAGLLAHLAEEQQQPLGFLWRGGPRRRSSTSQQTPERDARARGREPSVGRAARPRRRVLPRAARLPLRPLGLLSREAGGGGIRSAEAAAGSQTSRSCP